MVTMEQTALSTDQRTFYQENGYLLVQGLLSPAEAATYRQECHDLARRLSANASLESTWKSAAVPPQGARGTPCCSAVIMCSSMRQPLAS